MANSKRLSTWSQRLMGSEKRIVNAVLETLGRNCQFNLKKNGKGDSTWSFLAKTDGWLDPFILMASCFRFIVLTWSFRFMVLDWCFLFIVVALRFLFILLAWSFHFIVLVWCLCFIELSACCWHVVCPCQRAWACASMCRRFVNMLARVSAWERMLARVSAALTRVFFST